MLATSNVPVWAAEFSDGTEAAVATEAPAAEAFDDDADAAPVVDDAETPVIEDNTESVAVATAASAFDFSKITVNEKAKNPTWDKKGDAATGKVAFESTIFNGNIVGTIGTAGNYTLKYAWAYNGTFASGDLKDVTNVAVNQVEMPETSDLKAHVGETISLLFVESGTTTPIAKIELGTVQKVDISKTGFALKAITGETYNGAKHEPEIKDTSFATAPSGDTYKVNGNNTLNIAANYTWGYAGTDGLVNAKSKVTVTGTYVGVDADKYTGTMTTTFEIDKLALKAAGNDFIIKAATPGKEFSYTGNATQEVDKSEVNVYLADAKDKNVASDVLLNDFVKKVTINASSVSAAKNDKVFTVTFDTDKISQSSNFKLDNNVTEVTETSSAKYGSSSENNNGVNVVALDLTGVTATLKNPLAKQTAGVTSPKIAANQLKFVKDGKTLDIADGNLAITVTPADYSKTGTYSKAITITGTGGAKGTIYADLVISDKAFDNNCNFVGNTGSNVFLSKDSVGTGINQTLKYNNGKAVEFSKDQLAVLGDFCPDGNLAKGGDQTNFQITYDNNVNASGTKLAKLTVTAIAGEYKGCSQDFYFKIDPSQVVPAADKTTTVTTNAKKSVPGVAFNEANKKASDYAEAIGLKVTGTNGAATDDKKVVSTATTDDYTVKYTYVTDKNNDAGESETTGNEIRNYVKAVITLKKDGNFATPNSVKTGTLYDNTGVSFKTTAPSSTDRGTITLYVPILKESIESLDVSLEQTSYTYTGAEIEPKVSVKLNGKAVDASEYKVKVNNGINVGTAEVVVEMNSKSDYQGSKTLTATITPAKISDLKFVIRDTNKQYYNGKQKKPVVGTEADIKLGKVSLNDMFDVAYGKNIDAGKEAGTVTLTPKAVAAKNFDGSSVTTTFDIERRNLENGSNWAIRLTNDDGLILDKNNLPALEWTGKEVEFANSSVILDNLKEANGQGQNVKSKKDYTYKVAYANNVDPTNNVKNAYVCLVGTGNYSGTYQIVKNTTNGAVACLAKNYVENANKSNPGMYEVLLDDVINGSFATFKITGEKTFSAKNVTITNATYAGGVTVKPGSVVKDPKTGAVLTEGKDYELDFDAKKVDVTSTPIEVTVKGLGQYKGTSVSTKTDGKKLTFIIEKKDLKDCYVNVDKKDGDLNLTVMNGNVVEKKENFDVKDNGDGTATVSVVDGGKSYTGSVNVKINDADSKVGTPMITDVIVKGNTVTPVLSSEVDGAVGYDYVISTEEDYKNGRVGVSKNILATNTDFHYVQKGTYYAYCHAWKRGADGKKVFGEWSNIYEFTVKATTPSTPKVTKVTVKGSTVTVTYTKSSDATGYDVILGSAVKSVNGEKRPVDYGTLVKKNIKGNVVTATFKNVPAGKYYAGVHSFNKTSEDGKKVFSKWSNSKAVTVK